MLNEHKRLPILIEVGRDVLAAVLYPGLWEFLTQELNRIFDFGSIDGCFYLYHYCHEILLTLEIVWRKT